MPANPAALIFRKQFGFPPPHELSVPLPAIVLGETTIPHNGICLGMAINRFVHAACAPRVDGKVQVIGDGAARMLWVTEAQKPTASEAQAPFRTFGQLAKRGVSFNGFDLVLAHDDLPLPATSVQVGQAAATVLAVRRLFPFTLTESGITTPPRPDRLGHLPPLNTREKQYLAHLCASAFGSGRGCFVGSLVALCGKAAHLCCLDLQGGALEHLPLIGEAVVFSTPAEPNPAPAASGFVPADIDTHLRSAAEKLGLKNLRSLESSLLQSMRSRLTPLEYAACLYHVTELKRVVSSERVLQGDDHAQFGLFLNQSHDEQRGFRAVDPFVEASLQFGRSHMGCIGSRGLAGAPAGAALHFVNFHQVENFRVHVAARVKAQTGTALKTVVCQLQDGCSG